MGDLLRFCGKSASDVRKNNRDFPLIPIEGVEVFEGMREMPDQVGHDGGGPGMTKNRHLSRYLL